MKRKIDRLEDILETSHKADIIEMLSDALDTEGAKVVIVTGIPNKDTEGLDVSVNQSGHLYAHEEVGFLQHALQIVVDYASGGNEDET